MAMPLRPRPSLPTPGLLRPKSVTPGSLWDDRKDRVLLGELPLSSGVAGSLIQCLHLNSAEGPRTFLDRPLPTSLLERKSGDVPSAWLRVPSTSLHPIVPGSPRAAQTVGVRFCGAPHILGYLTHSASSPKIPAKSGIPPSEELAVPRTPSASPPSDSDSREDKVRGSLCLIVSPTCWQNS